MPDKLPVPDIRMRRLRYHPAVRRLLQATKLDPSKLILALCVRSGEQLRHEISTMPGQFQLSIDELIVEAQEALQLGLGGILLFGVPDDKDATGSDSYAEQGIVQRAVGAVKEAVPELLVITDVCFCEYTDHGHCGILGSSGEIDNDATLPILSKMALAYADAGADAVAPSDMMDGRVGAIRRVLDDHNHSLVPIISYAAKYSSSYYGPFRDIANSCPSTGDRKSYQMDPSNVDEAMREVDQDIAEGVDIIIVKPAGSYLDVLWRVKQAFGMPTAAYQVSGEYAMIKAAGQKGWVDTEEAVSYTHLTLPTNREV